MEGAGSRGLRGTYLCIKNDAKKKLCRPTGPEKSHKSWRDFFFFFRREGWKKKLLGVKKKNSSSDGTVSNGCWEIIRKEESVESSDGSKSLISVCALCVVYDNIFVWCLVIGLQLVILFWFENGKKKKGKSDWQMSSVSSQLCDPNFVGVSLS